MSDALEQSTKVIARVMHRMNRYGFTDDQLDDLMQQCMMHLWQKSLPRFDTRCGASVKTYLHKCAFEFFRMEMPRAFRRLKRAEDVVPVETFNDCSAPDTLLDDKVADLARSIVENPEHYLTSVQADVLLAIVNHPGLKQREVASMLGYHFACDLNKMLRRIKRKLADLDIEGHEVRT